MKLTIVLALLLPAAQSRARDRANSWSGPSYGWGALFYPQQGLTSSDCQYTLTSTSSGRLDFFYNGWPYVYEVWGFAVPYRPGYYGYQLDADTGHLLLFTESATTDVNVGHPTSKNANMVVQTDGHVCIYDALTGAAVWCSGKPLGVRGPSSCRPSSDHPLANSLTYYYWGMDAPGNDTHAIVARDYRECGQLCTDYYGIGECNTWTFVSSFPARGGTCWLKWGTPAFVLKSGDRRFVTGRIVKD